jgi:hypothetical protein
MSKRHFEAIARILADAKIHDDLTSEAMRIHLANSFASYFASINPNFNAAKFAEAGKFSYHYTRDR